MDQRTPGNDLRSIPHDFCWDCMNKWDTNCGYTKSCNGVVKEGYETENERKIKNEAASEIRYYLSHYQSYMKQKDAIKFAQKLKSTLDNKIDEWKMYIGEISETGEFLYEAIETVIWSRNILKHIIIAKYFMEDENKKILLNHYIEDMIIQTELLTSLTEKSIQEINKINILNTTGLLKNSIHSIQGALKQLEE